MANLLKYKGRPQAQRVLVYGGPKTGKTVLAGKLAEEFKVLWLDLERGYSSLLQSCTDEQLSRIEYIAIPDSPDNPVACVTLLRMWEQKRGYICEDHGSWNCPLCTSKRAEFFQIDLGQLTPENGWVIVLDTGTQFGQSALNFLMKKDKIAPEDGDKATYDTWGAQGAFISKLGGMIQAGNNHVLMTAHEIEVEMPDKSKKLVASMGTRNVAANFGKYFDHVIRLKRQAGKHKGDSLTTAIGNFESGSRWGLNIEDPKVSICDFFRLKVDSATGSTTVAKTATPTLAAKPLQAGTAKFVPQVKKPT